MKKYLLTTALVIFVVLQGFAQRFDYENTSKIFFGLNIGSVWHTSDVENAKERFPLGAGFVFGGSMNQNYGNAVSFDLRFRYLGGTWYGKDSDTTSAILNNYAVKPLYDSLGYTVQNFRAAQHRFALELSMHANRFKERTGFDPYIFAGIGITASNINGDLLKNSTAEIYPYNETPNGSIIDEKYETPLDMNALGESYTSKDFDFKVLPSLGVGIGYYFNNRFSMGIEHKTTFFMDDYFDGTTLNQEGRESNIFKNDLYHYTSIYFKWYLRGTKRAYDQAIDDKPIKETPAIRRDLPVVDFTNPSNSPHRTNSQTINLKANVRNVVGANNITFTGNQQNIRAFSFNNSSQTFQATVRLLPGLNTFLLQGENQFGNASDVVEIYYEETIDRGNPPIVKITDPARVPFYVNQLSYSVQADIKNVDSRNNIKVWLNDKIVTHFDFNANGNKNFLIHLKLEAGTNTLKIEGRNEYGQDTDEAIIIYERQIIQDNGKSPIVNILTPSANPYTTSQQTENIIAKVENIDSKQNIEVVVNGAKMSNFTFNNSTGRVQFTTGLSVGINIIHISARNSYGNDFDETQIVYRRGTESTNLPPIVGIISPSASPYQTSQSSENVQARIENVERKNQVNVIVNGKQTNNFSFNRISNSNLSQVQLNAVLSLGTNTIRITATNPYGNHYDETQFIYRASKPNTGIPPVVKILSPSVSPFTTNQLTENIVAEVKHINTEQQIEVRINGNTTNNFTFNTSTNRVFVTASLNSGMNTIRVSAANTYGNDFDETQIIYRRGSTDPVLPPVVQILTPNVNPFNTNQLSEHVIAKVENVDTKQQIEVRINGIQTNNFIYNSGTNRVQFNASLNEGINTIKVSATNVYGNNFDDTKIIFRPAVVKTPPVVDILTPNVNPFNTNQLSENVIAKVENVENKSQIEVLINGTQTNNFTFNSGTSRVQFNASLTAGTNTVKVSASNAQGNAFDETKIIYRPVVTKTPPIVNILTPNTNPLNTYLFNENVIAKVENVDTKQQIEVQINGIQTNNFTFNSATSRVQFTAVLKAGKNIVRVSASNPDGTDFDESTIIYDKKIIVKPPFVSFIAPKIGQKAVDGASFNMIAKVERVAQKGDVKVYLNGNLINPNDYTFNSQSQTVNYPSQLIIGENTFIVSGKNEGGNHQASIKIERNKRALTESEINKDIEIIPCKTPTIAMISPKTVVTKLDIDGDIFNVKATIENINNVNQIQVYLNGGLMGGHNYNPSTKSFTHLIKLAEGKNTYIIKVTNSCGTVEKELIFNREAEPGCGVKLEMINLNSEFCLTTSSGTITSSDLISNPNFNYNGQASSIYFKATSNGKAIVNGVEYDVISGMYYHFVGIITVDIAKNKPGMNNQWSVCVGSVRPPLFGKGATKPNNPCATVNIKKPVVKPKPNVRNKPDTQAKPNVREKPPIKREGTQSVPSRTGNTPEPNKQKNVNPRNTRNPDGRI